MRKGYCAVTCDILHPGHIRYLKTCRALCDWLVVGVMVDKVVRRYKRRATAMPFHERFEVVKAIKYANEVIPQSTFEFTSEMLEEVKPDIVFDSTEHSRRVPVKYERMLIKYTDGISSTKIKERIVASSKNRKNLVL